MMSRVGTVTTGSSRDLPPIKIKYLRLASTWRGHAGAAEQFPSKVSRGV